MQLHLRTFFLFFFLLGNCFNTAWGQDCAIPVCNEAFCGGVFVLYLPAGNNVFCEGGTVTLDNITNVGLAIEQFQVDWGDGSPIQIVNNYNSISHTYNYPGIDPCSIDNGVFIQNICYMGKKNCSAGQSCHWTNTVVSVKLKPKSDFTAAQEVCVGTAVNFTEQTCNADTYLWNFGDGQTATTPNASHTFAAPGTYNVCLTATNECGNDMYCQTVQVVPEPEAAFAYTPASGTGCTPLTVDFTNQSNFPYVTTTWSLSPNNTANWDFTEPSMNFNSEDIGIIFQQPGVYNVSLTATNVCGNDVMTVPITVLAGPTISIAPIADQCQTTYTVNPSATTTPPGATITWQFPGGTPSTGTGASPGAVTFNGAGNYTITASITNECGTISDTEEFLLVDPNGGTTFPSETFCLNATPFNLDNEVAVGNWDGNGVNSSDVFTPSSAGAGMHTLTYTQQVSGCNIVSNLTVTVLPLPTVSAGTDQTVCIEDAPFTLSSTPSAGGIWSGGSSTGLFDPEQAGVGNYTFTYSYTNAEGCTNTDDVQITVQGVSVNISDNETNFCDSNTAIQLTATPAGGTWSGNGVQPNGVFTPSVAGVGVSNLLYTYSDSNGCTDTDTLSVTVVASGSIDAGNDLSVCADDAAFSLQAIEPAGGTWSGTGVSGTLFNPQTAGVGTHILTYTVGSGTCLQTDNLSITVNALPSINATIPDNLCIHAAPFNLSATPTGGVWSGPGITDTLNGTFWATVAGIGTTSISYNYTDPTTGCIATVSYDINVYQIGIDLSANETTYCNTDNVYTLVATVSNAIGTGNGIWSGNGVEANGNFNPSVAGVGTHTIIYSFLDASDCSESDTLLLSVIEAEQVSAGIDEEICQNGGIINLSGFSPAGGTFSGAGIVGNTFDPTLALVGNNTINYTVGSGSCEVIDTKSIVVLPVPAVNAGNNQSICFNEGSITLDGTPIDGAWSGDGVTPQGTFTPPTSGTFPLLYTYTNVEGCTDSSSVSVYVEGIPPFSFAVNDTVCIGDPIIFNVTGGAGTICTWDYGDGTISNNCNEVHSYTTSGLYIITLSVQTPLGCTDSTTQSIFVTAPPIAQFSHDADNSTFICTPLAVSINNQSNTFGSPATFIYDWGNGDALLVTQNPDTLIQYTYQGNYIVSDTTFYITLTVTNPCGTFTHTDSVKVAPTPQVTFGPTVDNTCSGTPLLFNPIIIGNPDTYWIDWGDGSPIYNGTETDTISHTFFALENDTIYTVCIGASNECGTDTRCWDITIHPNTVTSFFYASTVNGCAPLTGNFIDFSTDITIEPEWDFGDGNLSVGDSVSHTFLEHGTYIVSNYASNGCAFDTSNITITVLPIPVITAISAAPIGCVNTSIPFSVSTDVAIAAVIWDFGDGTPLDSTVSPIHHFEQSGTYTVTVTVVSSGNQCSKSSTTNITIVERPNASFTGNFTGCSPLPFITTNTSIGNTYQTWNFGDGNTSAQANPQHLYVVAHDSTFTAALIAYNDNGCADTAYQIITVYAQPKAAFTMSDSTHCQTPTLVSFANTSQNSIGAWWNMGNSYSTTNINPDYVYEQEGNYLVTLIVDNVYGCKDTATHPILVVPQPFAIATLPPGVVCVPSGITPLNQSTNATDYLWVSNDGQTDTTFTPNFSYNSPGQYSLMLIATNQHICPDTAITMFTVHPSPTADFTFTEIIDPIPQGLVQFEDQSYDNITTWLWNFSGLDSSILQNPQYRFLSKINQAITLTVTNNFGCPDDTTQYIKVQLTPGLFFPNAFTPDSGIPEVQLFKPKGVCLKEYKIEIYDKWGGLLWESDLLHEGQPAEGWDGTFRGQPVPQGSYVWKAKAVFEDGTIWQGKEYGTGKFPTGTVTLIR